MIHFTLDFNQFLRQKKLLSKENLKKRLFGTRKKKVGRKIIRAEDSENEKCCFFARNNRKQILNLMIYITQNDLEESISSWVIDPWIIVWTTVNEIK